MPIQIADPYLEKKIKDESDARGYSTKAKAACVLIQERLSQLEVERRDNRPVSNPPEGQGAGNIAAPAPSVTQPH